MEDPVVNVEEGKLQGKLSKCDNGFQYFTFMGIPYAKPPVGELRFCVTQPPERWEGVWDATKTSNICPQFDTNMSTVIGDEDCLYLNVYTPRLPSTSYQLLPVMVFIHGGGFTFGNGTDNTAQGPDYLIERNVVIVSLNYRVGILGFLSLNRKEAPGNMGLMDQVQALRFVQKNIACFGGDPNNVTIFGTSAGGASIGYLMLSPMAKGLFHKAIAQSGSPLQHWALNNNIKKLAFTIPCLRGDTVPKDDQALLEYLKKLPTAELVSTASMAVSVNEFRGGIHFGFTPTVEQPGDWEPFLSKSPYQLLAQGEFTKVPFMNGFCTQEGLLMIRLGEKILDKLIRSKNFIDYIPFDLDNDDVTDLKNRLKTNYPEEKNSYGDADDFAIKFFTDVDFLGGTYVSTKLTTKYNTPVYLYEFSYDGNLNAIKERYKVERKGACHGDERGYIMKMFDSTRPITDTDAFIKNTMTTMWTNLAKYGNPTPMDDHTIPTKWEPVTNSGCGMPCLVIDKNITMKYDVYPQRMKLFEELYEKYGAE